MKIKSGGTIKHLKGKIETIHIGHEGGLKGDLWINQDSLSYLTIDELIDLRNEINTTLRKIIDV